MIERILLAIDDSPSAMNAANYGIHLAKKIGATAGIVYVTRHNIGNIDEGILPATAEKSMQQSHDSLMTQIDAIHKDINLVKFDPIGNPEKEIANITQLWKPDLLVIGHHHHTFFQKITGKNTEYTLLESLKIPLLIVPLR